MARIRWPARFAELMERAMAHETAHQYRAAMETYLLAAANARDDVGEEIAVEYARWQFEKVYPDWRTFMEHEMVTDPPPTPEATPQGDGDPGDAPLPPSEDPDEPVL